jgi:hypothetical protein
MYIPKSRILTNQYTSDNKLQLITTGEYYTGYYYKTYNGKFYTGKTQNDPPNIELLKVVDTSISYNPNLPQNKIAYSDAPTIFDDINTPGYSEEMVVDYAKLQNIDLRESTRKYVPIHSYPTPTVDDYALGSFTRYFCVKINQPIYLELNSEIFGFIKNQDKKYLWEPYKAFSIQWVLIGDKKEVFNTNMMGILLLEKRLKLRGLQIFLKENYLKFYK